jgi:hypothetical protein
MDADSVFGLIETLFRGLAMHIEGGQKKLTSMFKDDLALAVETSLAERTPAMAATPAGEASTEGAAPTMTPQRTAEVSAETKAAARVHALLNASFSMGLKVFFALIRDGVNHIWRHENVTADEDSYHVLPFHLTALALGTDISMDSLDHLASILGLDEFPQSAWSFALACTAIEKALAAKGFTKNSVIYADGATRLQKARLMQQWLRGGGGGGSAQKKRGAPAEPVYPPPPPQRPVVTWNMQGGGPSAQQQTVRGGGPQDQPGASGGNPDGRPRGLGDRSMGGQGSSHEAGYGGSGASSSGFKGRQTDEERRHSVEQEAANMGEDVMNRAQAMAYAAALQAQAVAMQAPWADDQVNSALDQYATSQGFRQIDARSRHAFGRSRRLRFHKGAGARAHGDA